jgi:hypothetical protein
MNMSTISDQERLNIAQLIQDCGFRVCDDCDFVTDEGDCIVCPECKGSVG